LQLTSTHKPEEASAEIPAEIASASEASESAGEAK
jgi:hypothetical protein